MTAPEHRSLVPRTAVLEAIVAVAVVIAALIALAVAGARYGVLLPQARFLIEAGADGLKVGRLGRLEIEGLSGDIWRDVRVRKLTLRDEGGVWLEADNLRMRWRYVELLNRNFHADTIDIEALKVLRRPTLTAKGQDTGLPLSFHIDRAHARVEMLPAFSYERGVYDLALNLDVTRNGDQRGRVRAASVLHPGDHLNLDYDLAKARPLLILADGFEARGGALAGALGLPSNQAFSLKVKADGKMAAGQFTAVASSGATQPLKAHGDWAKEGGDARGMISLTASTLTAPYARRFGPTASFVVAGCRAGPGLLRAGRAGDLGEPLGASEGPGRSRPAADRPAGNRAHR